MNPYVQAATADVAPPTFLGREGTFARWKRLSHEVFWIAFGLTAGSIGTLVGVRILTGRLGPASYGELALGMTVVTVAQQTLTGPLAQAALRLYAPSAEAGTVPHFMATVRRLQLNISLAIVAVGISVAVYMRASSHRNYFALALLALALSVISGANGTLDSLQTAARHRSVVALHQAATQWSRPLAALLLIALLGARSAVALTGYLAASSVVMVSQVSQFRRRFPASISGVSPQDAACVRQFLKYAWPFSAWGLFTALQLSSDRWILSLSLDNRSVGIYTAATQLGFAPLITLSAAASAFLTPVMFSRTGDGTDPRRVASALSLNRQLLYLAAASSSLTALGTYLIRDRLVAILCGPGYQEVGQYLPWLMIAAGFFISGQIASHAMLIRCETHRLLAPKIVTGILTVAVYIVGARVAGINGVVTANIGVAFIYCLWILYLAARPNSQCSVS
jgi:lipopolysaccharide exporter